MSREEQNKHLTETATWLKDHVYTELVNANGVEVWRCKKPGEIHLAFDICITRFGIAVCGDIGVLSFGVGASYGMPFLAGKDGDYIYGKLDPTCKSTDFDRTAFIGHVEQAICEWLSHSRETAPDWFEDYNPATGRGDDIEDWLAAHCAGDQELGALCVALREAKAFEADSDPTRAHEWLDEREELLEISDSWEWSLRKPTDSVLRRLARVRHAAQMIMAQKEKAAAPVYAYALSVKDEYWCDDSLAEFLSDREIVEGAVIARAEAEYPDASQFLPDVDDVLEHMSNDAHGSGYSEFVDDFPSVTTEAKIELEPLLEPLKRWANKHCSVRFFRAISAEPYTVTSADVAAAKRYLDLQRQLASKDLKAVDVTAHSESTAVES